MAEGGPEDRRPGRRDGPPDLEELWRDLNRRISGLFRGRRSPPSRPPSGPPGPSPLPNDRGTLAIFGIVVAIVVAIWLASGFFIVQEGQTGVVLQFGRYKSLTGAGIQWRWPYPIQSNETVKMSDVRSVEVGYSGSLRSKVPRESLMLTDDENIIDLQAAVQFRVKDAAEYLFTNVRPDDAVKQAAETSIREVVGRSKMDTVLYEGRDQIAIQVHQLMQQILDRYTTGVLVTSVTVQNAQPPEQVQNAFDDAVKAGQDRERAKNEGQAYANDVIPRARGNAARLIQESAGYKQRVIAQAEGDASRFGQVVTEYSKAPEVTRQRMYLDTMQEIFAGTAKVLIDARSGGNLLMLPLDKLMQMSTPDASRAAGATTPAPGAAVSATPLSPADDARSREGMRNRDRDQR